MPKQGKKSKRQKSRSLKRRNVKSRKVMRGGGVGRTTKEII